MTSLLIGRLFGDKFLQKVVFLADSKEKLHKTLQPTSLLSAMWYQLAHSGIGIVAE
jgi:hypothetical protein